MTPAWESRRTGETGLRFGGGVQVDQKFRQINVVTAGNLFQGVEKRFTADADANFFIVVSENIDSLLIRADDIEYGLFLADKHIRKIFLVDFIAELVSALQEYGG
jgi:hypothetical protein